MANVLLICRLCKKTFQLPQWRVDEGRGKFCSLTCLHKRKGKLASGWKGGKDIRVCKRCGKKFVAWPYQKTKHCSLQCASKDPERNESIRKALRKIRGPKHRWWKGGKEFWAPRHKKSYNCLDCGIMVWSKIHPRCKKCSGLVRRKQSVIEKEIEKLERERFSDSIHDKVLKRDNYTCQICGSKKHLQVDHIQSWKEYVELRFDMNNCRTLCVSCHYFITYGRPMPESSIKWGRGFVRTIN